MRQIDYEACHQCEKSKDKIVCITIDKLGITRCNYCNQIVKYNKYKAERMQPKSLASRKSDLPS